jgi:hypothetical protein
MTGSKDLEFLLENMLPEIVPGEYVFATANEESLKELSERPLMTFREREAITIILRKEIADTYKISYGNTWGLITLSVYSDITAIGFLSEVTRVLAEANLSVNVVSAFHHDHLFVPYDMTHEALRILTEFSSAKAK